MAAVANENTRAQNTLNDTKH